MNGSVKVDLPPLLLGKIAKELAVLTNLRLYLPMTSMGRELRKMLSDSIDEWIDILGIITDLVHNAKKR